VHTILQSHDLQTQAHGFNIQVLHLNKQTEQGNPVGTDLISQKRKINQISKQWESKQKTRRERMGKADVL